MSTQPRSVVLRELTGAEGAALSATTPGVNLGNRQAEARLNDLIRRARTREGTRIFVLDWEGSKVPRGVVVDGHEIAWTQNGMVTSTDRRHVGTYDRTVEYGGESGEHHQMVIYI